MYLRKKYKYIISFILIIIGISLIIYKLYIRYEKNKIEIMLLDNYFKNNTTKKELKINNEEKYELALEIPKINLKKGLYNINSKKNNVNSNIQIIEESDMPDIVDGNLILASHSGNGKTAYFKNLYKLELNDTTIVHYNNKKYIYGVINKYEIDKIGKANIIREANKNILTLITCNQKDKSKQLVIISELLLIEEVI